MTTPPHIEKAARELCKHFGDEPDERDGITLEWRRWHEYESIAGEICDIAIEEAAKRADDEALEQHCIIEQTQPMSVARTQTMSKRDALRDFAISLRALATSSTTQPEKPTEG